VSPRAVPEALAHKLTAAAAGEFASSFDAVRMEDIAAASGVPRATLYYYFAGKDDVLAFLLRSMLDDLRLSVATALEVGGSARTRLEAVVRAQLAHLAANPATSQLLLMNLGRAGLADQIAGGIDAGFHGPVREILRDGISRGDIVDVDVELAATAVYAAVTIVGLQSLVVAGAIDVDGIADRLFPLTGRVSLSRGRARAGPSVEHGCPGSGRRAPARRDRPRPAPDSVSGRPGQLLRVGR
jgi:TetR/AcrR family transcriptional regulator